MLGNKQHDDNKSNRRQINDHVFDKFTMNERVRERKIERVR